MDLSEFSLADFLHGEDNDPLVPPDLFTEWLENARWAASLYEPQLLGPPVPRGEILRAGKRTRVINLTSYNYLGFATHPEVVGAAHDALSRYGTGACGSPVLSGMTDLHARLERELAEFLGREAVMLYNSGFGGALGAVAGLLRRGDAAILDARCHMSLLDGARTSGARIHLFRHNEPASLDEALEKTTGCRRLAVMEGLYSMDGDMADLPALLNVAEKHGCSVLIDEAHSILAWGAHGRGACEHLAVESRVGLFFATFSKAFAGLGGFLAGRKETLDYLRFYSNPYGFSCALPPSVVAGLLKVLEITRRDHSHRERLQNNAGYFREQLTGMGLDIGQSTTQVVPIIIGSGRILLYELCHSMNERGLFLAPVDYPTVPEDSLRFRVAVTAAHTREDLDEALEIIKDTVVKKLHG